MIKKDIEKELVFAVSEVIGEKTYKTIARDEKRMYRLYRGEVMANVVVVEADALTIAIRLIGLEEELKIKTIIKEIIETRFKEIAILEETYIDSVDKDILQYVLIYGGCSNE